MIQQMKYDYYPAIFKSTDFASNKTQSHYLNCIKTYYISLIIGVGLGVYGITTPTAAIIAVFLFLIGISITILNHYKRFENKWYNYRAIAESIKSSTWKFMMRANPFESNDKYEIVHRDFLNLVHGVITEHKKIAEDLATNYGTSEQITQQMKEIRLYDLETRKEIYRKERIDDQRIWYSINTIKNKKKGNCWFWVLIALHGIAILLLLFRIEYPGFQYWPSEIFIIAGSGALTWIQVKKFRELASAYGLAAHEIGTIRGELEYVKSEEDFAHFVNNAENAFSREHTQWISRKDQ